MKKGIIIVFLALSGVSILSACKKDSTDQPMPDILISNSIITIAEDDVDPTVNIQVVLSSAFNKVVSIDFATVDSTAKADSDYTAVQAGTLTFQPGETTRDVKISIIKDTANKQDTYFKLVLSNPVNAILASNTIRVKIINVDYAKLVWNDEFNDATLNTSYWNYELGNNNGWGNNESEIYTNSLSNVHLDSGFLHITALSNLTSGRLTTQGKKQFTYGKVEIRAKLPEGKGLWPALWMLGSNISSVNWPKCGEIDIMELLGDNPNKAYATVHYDNNGHQSSGSNTTLLTGSFSSSFHLFTFIWTPNHFTWMIDNLPYYQLSRTEVYFFPFDLPEFFIFNVAIGGNWPGSPNSSTVFPQNMMVDYIRVYQ